MLRDLLDQEKSAVDNAFDAGCQSLINLKENP